VENVQGRWRFSGQAVLELGSMASRLSTLPVLGSYRLQLQGDAAGGEATAVELSHHQRRVAAQWQRPVGGFQIALQRPGQCRSGLGSGAEQPVEHHRPAQGRAVPHFDRMTMNKAPVRTWCHAALLAMLAASLALPPALAQTNVAPRSRAPVTVNFVNADIEAVTRAFAAMIERPILVDPRVKGSITVYSEQPQSVREAYASYQAALRGLGFAVVESGGLLKLVPEAEAKLQAGTVAVGEAGPRGDQIITQIFPLRHENPNNLVAVLRPLISANNTINASVGSNSLIITDYADNLQRLGKIIAALDQPSATDVEIVTLQYAVAADLAPLVQRLEGGGAAIPGAPALAGAGSR
jgi:hypothetical protein